MEKELIKKVNFNKGGTGSYTPKVNLNMEWVKDMNITIENNEVIMKYDEVTKEITIRKK